MIATKNRRSGRLVGIMAVGLSGLLGLVRCSSLPRIDASVHEFVQGVYTKSQTAFLEQPRILDAKSVSFEDILRMTVLASKDLELAGKSLEKNKILLEQAKSQVLPRIHANVLNRIFIGNNGRTVHNILDGGLLFDYDFLSPLISSDLASVGRYSIQKDVYSGQGIIQKTGEQLLSLLLQIELHSKLQGLYEEERNALLKGRAEAEGALARGRIGVMDMLNRKKTLLMVEDKIEECRQETRRARQKLGALTGQGGESEIGGGDFHRYIPKAPAGDGPVLTPSEAFDQAWQNRQDIRTAEIDLILSEIAYARSKKNWTDYFRVSFGLGEYYDYRNNEYAGVSVGVSLSIPVLDFGDRRRKEKTAEIERDTSRIQFVKMVQRVLDDVGNAVRDVEAARRRVDAVARWREETALDQPLIQRLLEEGKATILDSENRTIEGLEDEIQYQKALYDLNVSLLRLRAVQGGLVDRPLEEKILNSVFGIKERP